MILCTVDNVKIAFYHSRPIADDCTFIKSQLIVTAIKKSKQDWRTKNQSNIVFSLGCYTSLYIAVQRKCIMISATAFYVVVVQCLPPDEGLAARRRSRSTISILSRSCCFITRQPCPLDDVVHPTSASSTTTLVSWCTSLD